MENQNPNPKIHNIILLVDTSALSAAEFIQGESDPNDYCSFAGQEMNTNVELFTTKVTTGDKLIWMGLSTSSEADTVEITNIEKEAGKSLFEKMEVSGHAKKGALVVRGKKNQWEKYTISFTINGNSEKVYHIDPVTEWEPPKKYM